MFNPLPTSFSFLFLPFPKTLELWTIPYLLYLLYILTRTHNEGLTKPLTPSISRLLRTCFSARVSWLKASLLHLYLFSPTEAILYEPPTNIIIISRYLRLMYTTTIPRTHHPPCLLCLPSVYCFSPFLFLFFSFFYFLF